jgi:tRNA/rRNA methyltransferase
MNPIVRSWRIVLVRPRNPLNIGAAARAMANFGFRELVVVNPYQPSWQETRSAVGAEDVIHSARAVPSLVEAIGDAALVIGTTSGSRRNLSRNLLPLGELSGWLNDRYPSGRQSDRVSGAPKNASRVAPEPRRRAVQAALLFGSEKTGLSNEEMSYCHTLVRIPTTFDCPSMNLGQAVAVLCYEMARQPSTPARIPGARIHKSDLATLQSLEHIFERATRVLDQAGYLQPKSRAATILKLRQFLLGIGLTNYDARILGGVLAQIEWKLGLKNSDE